MTEEATHRHVGLPPRHEKSSARTTTAHMYCIYTLELCGQDICAVILLISSIRHLRWRSKQEVEYTADECSGSRMSVHPATIHSQAMTSRGHVHQGLSGGWSN